ncbi:MAG: cytochrome c [Pseudomonadota bacterium]
MKNIKPLLGIAAIFLAGAALFIYVGAFNVAADEPHSKLVFRFLEMVRERSIAVHASGIKVPPLNDPAMIMSGGADYNEMCVGCHLKPGMQDSELRAAMYPQPPDLTKVRRKDPAQTFWIIKHGIKMSAMPAWGPTHDDQRMWAMVAFLQQLPRLTPDQYQILTARGEEEDEHMHEGMKE